MISKNIDLTLISDGSSKSEKDTVCGIQVHRVRKLRSVFGETRELLEVIKRENPDAVITLMGLTTFLSLGFKIDKPAIGILTSPIYSLEDIKSLGFLEVVRRLNYTFIHLLGALTPRFLIRKGINSLKYVVVLSEANRKKLEEFGVDPCKVAVIPPGISQFDLALPDEDDVNDLREKIKSNDYPVVLYFGSPLTLRGTDTLIKAFAKVKDSMSCRLIFLSRLEHDELVKEEHVLRNVSRKEGVSESVEIVSGLLKPEEIREYVCAADLVALPFKIVTSDVPIGVLEAMALGKPVISTDVDGIPELLDGRGLVVKPNDSEQLAEAIITVLSEGKLADKLGREARNYMLTHPKWNDVCRRFMELISGTLQ